MAGTFYDASNVAVGVAALYLQAFDATTPAVDPGAPAGGPFGAPPTGWISPGGTDQGYSLTSNPSTQDIQIEEQATAVGQYVTTKTWQVTGALAEETAVNYALYAGGTVGTDTDGNSTVVLSEEPQFYAAILEFQTADGSVVHDFCPKASVVGTGDVAFRRAADKRMYGIQITSACTSSQIVRTIFDAPSG